MSTTRRPVRALLVAAAAFATGTLATHALASPDATIDRALTRASDLMTDGQIIRARAMLVELTRDGRQTSLSDAQRARAMELLSGAERRARSLDPAEARLQGAELALLTDDLLEAERLAGLAGQTPRAAAVRDAAAARRAALQPSAARLADDASAAFESGRYTDAKASLDIVRRAGLTLDPARRAAAESIAGRLIDLEMARGTSFDAPAALTLLADPELSAGSEFLLESATDSASAAAFAAVRQPIVEDLPAVPVEQGRPTPTVTTQPGTVTVQSNGSGMTVTTQPAASGSDIVIGSPVISSTAPSSSVATSPAVPVSSADVVEAARMFEAKSLLGEANRAFEERRLNQALDTYNRLLAEYSRYLEPSERSLAEQRRGEVQVQLNVQGGPSTDLLSDTLRQRDLERQRVEATFRNLMDRSQAALEVGDTTQARDLAAQARVVVNQGRGTLAEADYESRISAVEDRIAAINLREEQLRIDDAKARETELAAETAAAEAARLNERDRKILEAISRVRALQAEMKYDEALQVVDQILFLDPENPAGLLLRDVLQDSRIYRDYYQIQREKKLTYTDQQLDNERAMLAPDDLVNYPADWPAISLRRGQPLSFAESAANRAVLATLDDVSIPVAFSENPLVDVVGFIAANSRLNIDVDWASLAEIGIDRETPVTLRVNDVPLKTVLDRVVEKVSDPDSPAGWAVIDGILTIASDEVLRRNTTLELYDIQDLLFEVINFNDPPEFDLTSVLQSGGSGGGGASPFSSTQSDDQDRVPRAERVQTIIDLIQANVDPDGWTDLGGSTGSIDELNGNLIITQTPKSHRAIAGLLDKLRQTRAIQINVEARFLLVNQNFFEQIGFDLDVYFGGNSNEFQVARTVDPSLSLDDYFNADGTLRPNVTGGGLFPVDLDGDGTFDIIPVTQPVFQPGTNGDEWSPISGAQNSLGLTEFLGQAGGFAADIIGASPALGVSGRFLDDIQVDFLVKATQADQRTVSLTAPRLTFTNGQRAFIVVATQQTFVSDLTPIVSDSSVAFDPTVTPIVTDGVLLDVEGVASADRRYVTMTVQTAVTNTSFDSDNDITLTGAAGGTGTGTGTGGGATAEGIIQVPVSTVTQVNTTVTIPDQGTILLGGQRLVDEVEVETGVPVLSKIPILNRFFSNRIDSKEERTLLILMKPTILIQDEEEEKNFPGLLDQLGR